MAKNKLFYINKLISFLVVFSLSISCTSKHNYIQVIGLNKENFSCLWKQEIVDILKDESKLYSGTYKNIPSNLTSNYFKNKLYDCGKKRKKKNWSYFSKDNVVREEYYFLLFGKGEDTEIFILNSTVDKNLYNIFFYDGVDMYTEMLVVKGNKVNCEPKENEIDYFINLVESISCS